MVIANHRPVNPKNMTRRTSGLKKINENPDDWVLLELKLDTIGDCALATFRNIKTREHIVVKCPYGKPGTMLWTRENAFIAPPNFGDVDLCEFTDYEGRKRMVGHTASMDAEAIRCAKDYGIKQTPSIHVPRWASRDSYPMTGLRLERLQDITEDDAAAEGFGDTDEWPEERDEKNSWMCPECCGTGWVASVGENLGVYEADCVDCNTAKKRLRWLWDSINGKRMPWEHNPYLWVVSYDNPGKEEIQRLREISEMGQVSAAHRDEYV